MWKLGAETRTTVGLQAVDGLPVCDPVPGRSSSMEIMSPGVLSLTCGLWAGEGSGASESAL